jgi:hypothetical protein
MPRLSLALAGVVVALALGSPPAARADDYWTYADRIQTRLDARWDEQAGYYRMAGGGVEPMANAMMLLTHSVAAMSGHEGAARNDHRARVLALRLVSRPPFVTTPATGQRHAPGWVSSMNSARAGQHLVFDAEVVDGLVYAYRARRELELPDATVTAIRSAIHRTAHGAFWRYPAMRLNQVNWYALMYAADATVTGDPTLLRRDLALQLRRFFSRSAANFGPGMRFHYLPDRALGVPMNVDSAEYANIVLTFVRFYDQARRAGMQPLPASSKRLMHAWIERSLAGYWTHGGYLNWDSGLGFRRWHQAKKLGLAQEALVGLAASHSLLPSPRWGAWAKTFLDRSLEFYDRLVARDDAIPPPVLFGVHVVPQGLGSALLAAARVEANAARAVDAGLDVRAGSEPPPLYAFDPDIGRLAVTTPAYNTAIVVVNQRAFPYGGLDLARLFDARQDVAANIGGRPPASFGIVVRDIAGKRVLASQTGRSAVPGTAPLRLSGPGGALASAARSGRAYAGPFTSLRADGSLSSPTLSVHVAHRFTRDWIQTSWRLTRRAGRARYTADALFPSWGGTAASVTAVLRSGERVPVGAARIPLSSIAYLSIRSRYSGYVVVPVSRPAGAVVRTLAVSPQSSDPEPGPTAAIEIARASRFNRATLAVRLTPVSDVRDVPAAAARLIRSPAR